METVYLVCAVLGGTILVVQTLFLAFGMGHGDADGMGDDAHAGMNPSHPGESTVDSHHEALYLKFLSLKALTAMLAFFGLAGLASFHAGLGPTATLGIAMAAGAVALLLVAWMMSLLAHLKSEGNVNIANAVGATAKVYLRIPAKRTSAGKVTVAVQGRTVECKAVTSGAEIPTGAEVRVVGLSTPDTLEVTRSEIV